MQKLDGEIEQKGTDRGSKDHKTVYDSRRGGGAQESCPIWKYLGRVCHNWKVVLCIEKAAATLNFIQVNLALWRHGRGTKFGQL